MKAAACPTCQGELAITERLDGGGLHSARCPTCFGTGDPESYGARVRAKLADLDGDELEEVVLELIESFYGEDGSRADEPLSGADFIEQVGQILASFHPDNLGLVPTGLLKQLGGLLVRWLADGLGRLPTPEDVAALIERLPHTTVREAVMTSCPPASQEEDADGAP